MNETIIRGALFGATFFFLTVVELFLPFRPGAAFARRWFVNIGLITLSTLILLGLPLIHVTASLWAASAGIGLFNAVSLPAGLAIAASFILLDFLVWAQHVAFHLVPPLWRLHAVHHADRMVDVTTGLRFHPGEMIVSEGYKVGVVVLFGMPVEAVVLFAVVLNASSMFTHGNFSLPEDVDGPLRAVMVTPDMHRVHHSVIVREHCSNYGFFLSVWDRLFRTYRAESVMGRKNIRIGLATMKRGDRFWSLLWYPFASEEKFPSPSFRKNLS